MGLLTQGAIAPSVSEEPTDDHKTECTCRLELSHLTWVCNSSQITVTRVGQATPLCSTGHWAGPVLPLSPPCIPVLGLT